jgi:hypothetical protein
LDPKGEWYERKNEPEVKMYWRVPRDWRCFTSSIHSRRRALAGSLKVFHEKATLLRLGLKCAKALKQISLLVANH